MKPTELLDELGIPYIEEGHEHCREGWAQLDCPSCSPNSQHWRMGFNLVYGYCNCWSCGRCDVATTLAESSGYSISQVRSLLSSLEREHSLKRRIVRGRLQTPRGIEKLSRAHRRYLESRRLDPDEIERLWEVKGIRLSANLAWRLFIPIIYHGEMVSWTTRSISDKHKLRYRSAGENEEAMPHKQLLYGEDYARHSIIVVEGPIDAWTIGPGTVATCGTGLSGNSQLQKIAKYSRRAICFDADKPGQKRAMELMHNLSQFPGQTWNIVLTSGKDANSASHREVREIRKKFLDV